MLTILAAGSVFFPGLFVLSKQCLKYIPGLRWNEVDAVIVSASSPTPWIDLWDDTDLHTKSLESNVAREILLIYQNPGQRYVIFGLPRAGSLGKDIESIVRLVSSVQAIMASSAGYIISSSCDDIIEDQHWLTKAYILFAVPYFVYDIYAMFMCYRYKLQVKGHEADHGAKPLGMTLASYLRREFLMVLHHVVMVTVCFPVSVFWRQGKGDYFQGVMFLAELSTPWVCLGKILIQYKQQHTLLHKVNGATMLVTFFICRVLLFPYLYYQYGRYASIHIYMVPFHVPWQVNLGAALLMAPQLYWFSLICRGALRLFKGSRKPELATREDSNAKKVSQPANGYSAHATEQKAGAH